MTAVRFISGLVLSLLVASGSEAEGEAKVPGGELGASLRRDASYSVSSLVLPGRVVAWSALHPGTEDPAIALAARTGAGDEDSLALFLWSPHERRWSRSTVEMPDRVDAVGFHPGGGAGSRILVFGDAQLLVLSRAAQEVRRLDLPSGFFPVPRSRWAAREGANRSHAIYQRLGSLESIGPQGDWSGLDVRWAIELPTVVSRTWFGLELESPPAVELLPTPDEGALIVSGPQSFGQTRMRSLLIDTGDEDVPEAVEVWSRFSSRETVEESWYVILDHSPALVVTTVRADKHGVFEKKKLRVFLLEPDRSRSGSEPLFEVVTRARNWYGTCVGVADIDGDGRDDLVSAQPQGLGGGKLWVAAYLRSADGGFEQKPIGTSVGVEEGERCRLDYDFDGDEHPDLVIADGDQVLVFRLLQRPGRSSRGVVETEPRWRIDLTDIRGLPRIRFLYSDSVPQIIATGLTEADHGTMSVIRFE